MQALAELQVLVQVLAAEQAAGSIAAAEQAAGMLAAEMGIHPAETDCPVFFREAG